MERWYVAQTNPRGEAQVVRHLTDQGIATFLPRYSRIVRHARRETVTLSPLFPGYLFLRLDPDRQRWRSVNGTVGVRRLVSSGDMPLPVPDAVMDELLARADAHGLVELGSGPSLRCGDKVEIVSGALAQNHGLFLEMDERQRIILLLDLLGRQVRVSVATGAVRPLA